MYNITCRDVCILIYTTCLVVKVPLSGATFDQESCDESVINTWLGSSKSENCNPEGIVYLKRSLMEDLLQLDWSNVIKLPHSYFSATTTPPLQFIALAVHIVVVMESSRYHGYI